MDRRMLTWTLFDLVSAADPGYKRSLQDELRHCRFREAAACDALARTRVPYLCIRQDVYELKMSEMHSGLEREALDQRHWV